MELIWQVYECDFCKRFGFEPPEGAKGFFKFPPTIGASGPAPLLFVGINPRKSASNERVHGQIMEDRSAFEAMSRNLVGRERYIRRGGCEPHYRDHVKIVEDVFGEGEAFEAHAAVTELFFCATEDSAGLPCATSPCANTYFGRVFAQVKPRLVVCVGKMVLRYFQQKFHAGGREKFSMRLAGHSACVMWIAHPGDPGTDKEDRARLVADVVGEAKMVVSEKAIPG